MPAKSASPRLAKAEALDLDLSTLQPLVSALGTALSKFTRTAEPPQALVAEWRDLVAEKERLEERRGEDVLLAAFSGTQTAATSERSAEIDRRLADLKSAFDHLPRVREEFAQRLAEARSALVDEVQDQVSSLLEVERQKAAEAFRALRDSVAVIAALQLESVLPLAPTSDVVMWVPSLRDDDRAFGPRAAAVIGQLGEIRRPVTRAGLALGRV